MSGVKRIEELPTFSELDASTWGGDFAWVNDDLHRREHQGLLKSPWGDGVVAVRNEDVFALQKHPNVTHQTLEASMGDLRPPGSPEDEGLNGFMALNSFSYRPPEHRAYKALSADQLSPSSLGGFRATFREIADEVLRTVAAAPAFDCFEEFGKPVVARVWGRLIGLTMPESNRLIELALDLALLNELAPSEELVARCNASSDVYMELFTSALRRGVDSGDYPVLNSLVATHSAMGPVGRPEEPLAPFASALADGFATLPVLISTAVWALAAYDVEHPDLADLDSWATTAFSEISRLHSPVLATVRQVAADFEYDGVHLPEGTNIWMMWVFANRDPAAFPEPLDFQRDRPRRKQVSFGGGAYSCTGLNIARIVCEEVLKSLALARARVRVEGQTEWSTGTLIHHLENPVLSVSLPES